MRPEPLGGQVVPPHIDTTDKNAQRPIEAGELAIALRERQGVDPRYTNKPIQVVGKVVSVSVEECKVSLLSDPDPLFGTRSVWCEFSDKAKSTEQLKHLKTGQTIQIAGTCADVKFRTVDQQAVSQRDYDNAKKRHADDSAAAFKDFQNRTAEVARSPLPGESADDAFRRALAMQPPVINYTGPQFVERAFWSVTIKNCTELVVK